MSSEEEQHLDRDRIIRTQAHALETQPDSTAIALTIAGFDPSSGAGFTADLKVFAAHGIYGVAAATALTVQATTGVRHVEPVASTLLAETLDCLAGDLPLAGIKIGMLATAENVEAVEDFLRNLRSVPDHRRIPIVLDPVLRSSSGHALLDERGIVRLRTKLLPLVSGTTPNVEELVLLTGRLPTAGAHGLKQADVAEAAGVLAAQFPCLAVIATGGHLDQPDDYLIAPGLPGLWLRGEWVRTRATHGTGCAYSSALLCGLISGRSWPDAARQAKYYVAEALRAATPMGKGGGSMHHLHALYPPREE